MLKLFTLPKITMTAGAAVPIYSSSLASAAITIMASADNDGEVYVGGSTVTSDTGINLSPGDTATIEPPSIRGHIEEIDLSTIYVVSSVTGDSVRVSVMRRD